MKILICLFSVIGLSGCAYSGYSPSYIISDVSGEPESVPSEIPVPSEL